MTERTIEPIEEGDDFNTQIRKMRDSGLDLYVALQVTVDLDKLKDELYAHQMTGHIFEGEEMQQIYRLPLIILSWFEQIEPEITPDTTEVPRSMDETLYTPDSPWIREDRDA